MEKKFSIVCTLFEGTYHYGVAALVNSLHKRKYRGTIYAGYKGSLPFWAINLQSVDFLQTKSSLMPVAEGMEILFVPLKTDYHLTNYKPDFMLSVWEYEKTGKGIFYFDPDIILVQDWINLENWILCGVAVSEDVNSPLQEFHPRRCAWRNYFRKYDITLAFKNAIYVNGGFIGVQREDVRFLKIWQQIQEAMGDDLGGLNHSGFIKTERMGVPGTGDFDPFGTTDQDALNAALEAYEKPISYSGKAVMAFGSGLAIIPHALGPAKPWLVNYLSECLKGNRPRLVDRAFLSSSQFPISFYSASKRLKKSMSISIASAVSKFYHK